MRSTAHFINKMAPFSIPAPCIIPLRLPIFGGPKSIDTNTKIQLLCETYLEHEIFYTLDGTKPQPYAGIVQGNKTIKYISPFCLPAGKIAIKALAINACVHTMCSSVITKCFDVLKLDSEDDVNSSPKSKQRRNSKIKKPELCENEKNNNIDAAKENISDDTDKKLNSKSLNDNKTNCLEEAFIGASDFDIENSDLEDNIDNESCFPIHCVPDVESNLDEGEDTVFPDIEGIGNESDFEAMEKLVLEDEKNVDKANATLTDSGTSIDTQFCCLKCDLTLQQCITCNKMNAVSSKFCIGCGRQLLQLCYFCDKWNPSIAVFCQYCGKKLGTRLEPYIRTDRSNQGIMAKPDSKDIGIQCLPTTVGKNAQTLSDKSPLKRRSSTIRRMPDHSPGRGYWHQQLDYICNHLKSHAYNNVEFRKEISEPSLCDFKSAHIVKGENNIAVTVIFTPLVPKKSDLGASDDVNSKEKS